MGLFTKDIRTLDDLFVHTLQDIYYAENQIIKALPTMISKTTDSQLKQGFEKHLTETKGHVKRLEQVFQMHGKAPKAVDCPAIDGIIKEANEVAGDIADKEVLDAALLASAQAVEMRPSAPMPSSSADPIAPGCCSRISKRKRLPTRS